MRSLCFPERALTAPQQTLLLPIQPRNKCISMRALLGKIMTHIFLINDEGCGELQVLWFGFRGNVLKNSEKDEELNAKLPPIGNVLDLEKVEFCMSSNAKIWY